jgi:hypothetical protein
MSAYGGSVASPERPRRHVQVTVQITHEQHAWISARSTRLGVNTFSGALRMVLQEAMNAEYRQSRADTDVEEGGS